LDEAADDDLLFEDDFDDEATMRELEALGWSTMPPYWQLVPEEITAKSALDLCLVMFPRCAMS